MAPRPEIRLRQGRGAWVAKVSDTRSRTAIDHDVLPVMRDMDDGGFHWGKAPGFRMEAEGAETVDGVVWWMHPSREPWRDLILGGVPIWVRKADEPAMGERKGISGRSVGIFSVSDATIDEDRIDVTFAARVAEAART